MKKATHMVDDVHFGASQLDQRLHHRNVPVLRGNVKRRPPVLHITDVHIKLSVQR